jgi:hypothetical protein
MGKDFLKYAPSYVQQQIDEAAAAKQLVRQYFSLLDFSCPEAINVQKRLLKWAEQTNVDNS